VDPDIILARYGEIGIKSPPVRKRFEQALQQNIEQAFETEQLDVVCQRLRGRFLLHSSDTPRAIGILRRIFGIVSVSPARVRSSRLPELLPEIGRFFETLAAAKPTAKSFAIRARRAGSHSYTSQELGRQGGGAVLDTTAGKDFRVDLTHPDIEVFVEVRDDKAYLYSETMRGPGGLPVGSQGRVLVMLKDLHSLVAAWLMMKRGCTIVPVHFEGPTGSRQRADSFEAVLRSWYFRGQLIHVSHHEMNEFPREGACVLCMRQMVRKAGLLARYKKCKAIVTGEAFSSTTVDNLTLFGNLTNVPVLRPILGTTPDMVSDFLQSMGLEASKTVPFFEACPLRTRGRLPDERIQALEQELAVEARAHSAIQERERPKGAAA
jgi:tRNA uracil 4-sulfurtransferase